MYRDNTLYPWIYKILTDYHDYTNPTGIVVSNLRNIMSGVQRNPNNGASSAETYLIYQYNENTDEIKYDGNISTRDDITGADIPMAKNWDMQSDYDAWLKDNITTLLNAIKSGQIIPDDRLQKALANGYIKLTQAIKVTQGKVLGNTSYDVYRSEYLDKSIDFTPNSVSTDGYIVATVTFPPII